MARLTGGYDQAEPGQVANTFDPVWITVIASPDECKRIGPALPSGQTVPQDEDVADLAPGWTIGHRQFYLEPADRRDVQHIAKRVEVETDDARLLDWMARGRDA